METRRDTPSFATVIIHYYPPEEVPIASSSLSTVDEVRGPPVAMESRDAFQEVAVASRTKGVTHEDHDNRHGRNGAEGVQKDYLSSTLARPHLTRRLRIPLSVPSASTSPMRHPHYLSGRDSGGRRDGGGKESKVDTVRSLIRKATERFMVLSSGNGEEDRRKREVTRYAVTLPLKRGRVFVQDERFPDTPVVELFSHDVLHHVVDVRREEIHLELFPSPLSSSAMVGEGTREEVLSVRDVIAPSNETTEPSARLHYPIQREEKGIMTKETETENVLAYATRMHSDPTRPERHAHTQHEWETIRGRPDSFPPLASASLLPPGCSSSSHPMGSHTEELTTASSSSPHFHLVYPNDLHDVAKCEAVPPKNTNNAQEIIAERRKGRREMPPDFETEAANTVVDLCPSCVEVAPSPLHGSSSPCGPPHRAAPPVSQGTSSSVDTSTPSLLPLSSSGEVVEESFPSVAAAPTRSSPPAAAITLPTVAPRLEKEGSTSPKTFPRRRVYTIHFPKEHGTVRAGREREEHHEMEKHDGESIVRVERQCAVPPAAPRLSSFPQDAAAKKDHQHHQHHHLDHPSSANAGGDENPFPKGLNITGELWRVLQEEKRTHHEEELHKSKEDKENKRTNGAPPPAALHPSSDRVKRPSTATARTVKKETETKPDATKRRGQKGASKRENTSSNTTRHEKKPVASSSRKRTLEEDDQKEKPKQEKKRMAHQSQDKTYVMVVDEGEEKNNEEKRNKKAASCTTFGAVASTIDSATTGTFSYLGWGVTATKFFDPTTYCDDPSKAKLPPELLRQPIRARRHS